MCLVDDILDLGWHSCVIRYDDQPLDVVNKVGLLWTTIFTILSFPCFHAFQDGRPWMIWDSYSSYLEEPNVNEKEWNVGFHIGTITMFGLSNGACRNILK